VAVAKMATKISLWSEHMDLSVSVKRIHMINADSLSGLVAGQI
jgi:hypothetical protein